MFLEYKVAQKTEATLIKRDKGRYEITVELLGSPKNSTIAAQSDNESYGRLKFLR